MSDLTTRRQFLVLAAGGGATALVFAFKPWRALVETAPARPTAARLADLFENRESAQAIGREYLRQVPAEASAPLLVSLIAAGVPDGGSALSRATGNELRTLVAAGMIDDFAGGRTAELQGWVLSLTEARLCALTSLA